MTPLKTWLQTLRVHQWTKNGLQLLPVIAAHVPLTGDLLVTLLMGLAAFSAAASATYLLNDVADIEYDRHHPGKRSRAIAEGRIGISAALAVSAGLLIVAALIALQLPVRFALTLLAYVVLSAAYSLGLKRVPVLDVVLLGVLYTSRLVAGAALVTVPLSRWFLALSIFFFLALAIVKRVVELQAEGADQWVLSARGYMPQDRPTLIALGASSSIAAALVYCLYITSADVHRLYATPDLLWFGLPVLVYWQGRVWLLANRNQLHADPVVFALRDGVTWLLLGLVLVMVWAAR